MASTQYVQLPPDGVGKKVRHRVTTDIVMTSVAIDPAIGLIIYGGTSGAFGKLTGKFSQATITWYLEDVTGTFQAGEDLENQSGSTTYGVAGTVTPLVNTPAINIADPNTLENVLSINSRGAALTSFPEGTPQFDAWGRQQLSQLQAVAEYYFFTEDQPGKFYTTTNGGTSGVNYNPLNSSIVFTTGTGSSDQAKRVSNQYHPYKPGVSQLIFLGIGVGDAGKANVVREWGYFDDFNGFGFRLDGTSLKVFRRSDQSGTVVDTEISQANWNINTLDDAVSSDFLLNVNAPNLYWMDIQAQSARIRLGVQTPDGRRITCHEFRQVNSSLGFGLRNVTLPLTVTQRNTGSVSVSPASTQSMLWGGGVVFTESADILYSGTLLHLMPEDPVSITSATEYKPFLNFKAKTRVSGPVIPVTQIVAGFTYRIVSVGDTNFTTIGASANVVGVEFVANAAGTGTGTAQVRLPNSIIGIHETFDWASQGDSNIHVGIFVLPSEKWMNNLVWSETLQPSTMLFVDKAATDMAQYQYWADKATGIDGDISGTTLTVTAIGSGTLLKEMYLTASPTYANGPLYVNGSIAVQSTTGSVTARTRIVKQLTSTESAAASTTYGTQGDGQGVAGSNRIVVTSSAGVALEQLIDGTGILDGTYVSAVDGNVITLSQAMTTTGSGAYTFFTPGGLGTYLVDKTQTVASLTGWGGYYAFGPIESFVAPQNGAGRAALGDRIEKSFGLGGNPNPPEDAKGVFAFAAKLQKPEGTATLFYTKFWKEIR